jgi:hypothetical protein
MEKEDQSYSVVVGLAPLLSTLLADTAVWGTSLPSLCLQSTLLASGMQRQNAENLQQIFQEKDYRGLSPNFHIHVSVGELYIPTMGLPFLLEEICRPILGIYKSLTDT